MTLVALECPACGAPLKSARGTCPYCGATIEREGTTYEQVEYVYFHLARVGPSNRAGVARTLIRLGLSPEAAEHLVATSPSEVALGPRSKAAWIDEKVLFEAGASGTYEYRMVEVAIEPPHPPCTVRLEAVGPHLAKVLLTLREFVDLDIQGARDLLHEVPCVLGPPLAFERAQQFLAELVAAGATARLE
jgi:uncharacterized OB-fold protein